MNAHPTTAIPRVEVQPSHKTILHATTPQFAMMKLTHARRLIKRNELDWLPQHTNLITTTTVNDNALNHINWETELEYITTLNPAFHIPTDYTTYTEQPLPERLDNIQHCMDGLKWIHNNLPNNTDTQLIPLLKGETKQERTICYNTFDSLNHSYAAYYATQYFSSGQGNNFRALKNKLYEIHNEQPTLDILVIGLLSETYLEQLPPNVVAAAGQHQWRSQLTPTKQSSEEIKTTYENIMTPITEALPGIHTSL